MVFKNQIATIIITLLLALTFIGSLPYQFLTTSEKNKNILFTNQFGSPIYVKVDQVYKAFDLQKNIQNGVIKYPNFSKYINEFLIENAFSATSFSTSDSQILRKDFWAELGLINDTKEQFSFDLVVTKLPNQWSPIETGINVLDSIKLDFDLNYQFKSIYELEKLINDEQNTDKKKVLEDIFNFQKDLFANFNNGSYEIQSNYVRQFGELIEIENGIIYNSASDPANGGKSSTYRISDLSLSYESYFSPSTSSSSAITFLNDGGSETDIKVLFEELFYNPLYITARVLEQYFINFTSSYIQYTTNYINRSSDEWKDYESARNLYQISYLLNPIANLFSVFTYYSGLSSEDIWFDYKQNSSIDLHEQENMFLGYSAYTLKLINNGGRLTIDPNIYNKYVSPFIFIILQLIGAFLLLIITVRIYSRKDIV